MLLIVISLACLSLSSLARHLEHGHSELLTFQETGGTGVERCGARLHSIIFLYTLAKWVSRFRSRRYPTDLDLTSHAPSVRAPVPVPSRTLAIGSFPDCALASLPSALCMLQARVS
jgi:hypothetical protein